MSQYIIQSGKNSIVNTDFTPNLELDKPYEIALQHLETYYSFPNIDEKNNKIHVTLDGSTWYNLTFAVDCYEHKDTNNELQRLLEGKCTSNCNDNCGQCFSLFSFLPIFNSDCIWI